MEQDQKQPSSAPEPEKVFNTDQQKAPHSDTLPNPSLNNREQDESTATVFAKEAIGLVNHEDIAHILELQSHIHQKLQHSQESLTSFNEFSAALYKNMNNNFETHTELMKNMKKDLDVIFRRIRDLKVTLAGALPEGIVNLETEEVD